jgi:flagellar basal-body rod protein FlgF
VNSGFYAATAGLIARMQALDVAANNLANSGTTAFKSQREFYRTLQANMNPATASLAGGTPSGHPISSINRAINNFGVLGGAKTDLSRGSLDRTGNDMDAAIDGPGFFTLETPSGTRYTRNGSFSIGPHGELLSASGDPLVGKNGPIQLPPGQVSIGAGGDISVNGKAVDQLHIAEFAQSAPPLQLGSSVFEAPAAGELPAASNSSVRQGFLEGSNMNTVTGGAGLVLIQRQAEMLQKALTIFNSEFNKTATEEVARTT